MENRGAGAGLAERAAGAALARSLLKSVVPQAELAAQVRQREGKAMWLCHLAKGGFDVRVKGRFCICDVHKRVLLMSKGRFCVSGNSFEAWLCGRACE